MVCRVSLAAVLGMKTGAPSLFSGGVQSDNSAAQVLYPAGVNPSRQQLVSTESRSNLHPGHGCL